MKVRRCVTGEEPLSSQWVDDIDVGGMGISGSSNGFRARYCHEVGHGVESNAVDEGRQRLPVVGKGASLLILGRVPDGQVNSVLGSSSVMADGGKPMPIRAEAESLGRCVSTESAQERPRRIADPDCCVADTRGQEATVGAENHAVCAEKYVEWPFFGHHKPCFLSRPGVQ